MFSSTVSRNVWVRIIGRSTDPLNLQLCLFVPVSMTVINNYSPKSR